MSNITLTIPNDDHIALRAFGKALEEMALAREPQQITTEAMEHLNLASHVHRIEPEVDTTAQQVESLVPGNEYVPTVKPEPEITFTDTQGEQVVPTTDSTGTPWDERIHSASKALNADGTWRLRRKLKDMDELEWAAFVESVKNELMGVDAQDLKEFEESKQAILEPPVTPPGDDFHTDVSVVTEQTVAGIPPLPVPPPVPGSTSATDLLPPAPVPTALPTPTDWTFPKLMTFLTERQGKIDVPTVNMLLAQDGIASLPELNAHPDKIGPFVARVKAHLGE